MRPLRPGALPSDTSVRFVLLLAAVTTATLYLFQALWFVARGQLFVAAVRSCGLNPEGLTPTTLGGFGSALQADEACRAGVSREQAVVAIAGAALVMVAAWGLYRLLPAWRERRRRLSAPDPLDGAALSASVAALAEQAGVRPAPLVRLDVADPAISGIAYGSGPRLRLGLSGGLVVAQVTQPATYDAVVRHELGHVANRDVRWTYYAVATWWSFVGLALVPVVLAFAFRDPQYILRLGWRTAFLAALVGITLAAVLRTRELYADARAADWGSAEALDAVLARPTVSAQRRRARPRALRLHPDPEVRRGLLSDPDGLFTASGWVALAAALATGTALASIGDISYLLIPDGSIALSTLVVAPLLAIALCLPAWRVALRGAVRGVEPSVAVALGLGAGIGLAAAPLLTIAAAVGGTATSTEGWVGYLIWSVGMVGVGLAVAWWICGTARLAVTAALGSPRGPGRALVIHVVVVSCVVALWLSVGAQARLLLTNLGPELTWQFAPWDLLPSQSFGFRLTYLPLALAALLLVLPVWAYLRTRHGVPVAAWLWRDGQPTQPGDLARMPDAGATRPPVHTLLGVSAGAGLVAGSAVLFVLLAGEALRPDVRTSDTFALALGTAIEWAILAAGLVTGAVAVVVLPRTWWPMGLLSAMCAMALAAAGGWMLLTANRYGFLQHSDVPPSPLGLQATMLLLVRPAARAVVPCVLVVAVAGALRAWRASAEPRGHPAWVPRTVVGGLVAAVACGVLLVPRVAGVLGLQTPALQTASMTIEVPVVWTADVDPATDQVVLDSIDGEVRVVMLPIAAPGTPTGAGSILVGGVEVPGVGELDQGDEHWWVFEADTPAGGQRIVVIGLPDSVGERQDQIQELFDSVRWRTP